MSQSESMKAIYLKKLMRPFVRIILLLMVIISLAPSAFALDEDLQCVPYARAITGIEIYGDAHTWWDKAKGRYERGDQPKIGAILSFKPNGASRLGHISAVRALIDDRTILVSHANWSTINGSRGHIEDDVQVVDVSSKNDWSKVRVWYQPIGALGGTQYPINGFIYPKKLKSHNEVKASIAALTGRPIHKVALAERPDLSGFGKANQQKKDQRFAQLSTQYSQKEKRAERKAFKLEQAFIHDLERKSKTEKAQSIAINDGQNKARATPPSSDPIGDLLGQIAY